MSRKAAGTIYPLAALRTPVLHAAQNIVDRVTALGCVQIDTLHVVIRPQANQPSSAAS